MRGWREEGKVKKGIKKGEGRKGGGRGWREEEGKREEGKGRGDKHGGRGHQ